MDAAWQEAFEERAAIMEYCGKLPRPVAEALARKALAAAIRVPPEKMGAGYVAFREFWHPKKSH
jgi:hypothetical protein